MVMTMRSMHMAVRHFLFGRGPHFQHLEAEAQRLAGQRVVPSR